ncbi:ABC-type organic anion transporter ABCA8-like isoform X2 [Hyperolius riggenbachi]|uniref:ABC-type organic anion transporter ABCA8-like isoform X2 n=1 Tax=Hyperolius riggenbachi TaxID=752182 RepID=UPI0035A2D67E
MCRGSAWEPNLCHQIFALFWKNLLLKWRRKWHTLLELLQHLAFIFLMFLVAAASQNSPSSVMEPSQSLGRLDEFRKSNFSIGYTTTPTSAREIMQRITQSPQMTGIPVQEYDNEEHLLGNISKHDRILAGVFFQDQFSYHIRYNIFKMASLNEHFKSSGGCYNGSGYYCTLTRPWRSGFLFLQAAIDAAIIEKSTGKSVEDTLLTVQVVQMRSTPYAWRKALVTSVFVVGMCMCYVSLTYLLSLYVTRERCHMREVMKMMRLKDLTFWSSWALLYTVYVLIIANLMTLVVKMFVFWESSNVVLVLLFILYGLASISFTFMLSALFRNPRVTAIAGFFITLILSVSSLLLLMRNLPKFMEVILSIFPHFAFAVGLMESVHLENDLKGVFFSDVTGDSAHILFSYISLTLDTVFYFMLTLYFDKVLPDKYGMKHEPFFFLKASFWHRGKRSPPQAKRSRPEDASWGDYVERVPHSLQGKEAICINKIGKIYSGKDRKVEALSGLDFDVYEGQITALLGHSGAGKSTLLNILAGMCRATSGSASVYGYDLSDMDQLQEILHRASFCPQFDVKFDPLTVKENLKIFAAIKGIPCNRVEQEVQKVISDLQLAEVQDQEAGTLSGGQKRKLTLGISILGNPQVLLLDEPTAGLDPCSRHQVWAILKERKADRVTLLSTQFMDEADILADRKAVISAGRLKCVGSSLFLKRKWGIGYHLRMRVTSSCDAEMMTSLILQHITSAKLSSKSDQELTFTLPFNTMDSFPDLFSHLDSRVGQDIVGYGVSMTTLDDVFLKLEGEAEIERGDYGVFGQEMTTEEDRELVNAEIEESIQLMADSGSATLRGMQLWKQQVLAMARMRFLKLKHNMKSFRAILLLIFLFAVPLIIILAVNSHSKTMHIWELTPDLYFQRSGDKEHRMYSHLLLFNNTGSPIEDFTSALVAQNIVIDVTDGPYDPNTTVYRGAIEVSGGKEGYRFTIIGNPRAMNVFPVLLNIISNAILKLSGSDQHIRVWNNPVILTIEGEFDFTVFFWSLLAMVFATGMAPHFAMSSMEDTRIKARSQLHISGLFPSAYWCGHALVDISFYWLLLFLMTTILLLVNYNIFLDAWTIFTVIFEVFGYGAALVLYVYLIAFIFRKGKSHHDWWSFFFILALNEADMRYPYADFSYETSSFLSCFLIISYAQILLFSGMLWCLEWKYGTRSLARDPIFRTSKQKMAMKPNPEMLEDADEEVLAEAERVKEAKSTKQEEKKPVIIVDSLRKEFKVKSGTFSCKKKRKRIATRNISFCVKKGEVLGLLGPNGAGKTTSVYMLAGDLRPSAGEVELCGVGSSSSSDGSVAFLGYCSQENPLWPDLSVREHLEIYAAVKGMKKEDGDSAIRRVAQALELTDHLDKPAKKLSMGVSRKVCFAISMLGNPSIVLLDEPSTGLDPKGQQRLWRSIRAAFKNKDRGAILTTHYMEEAEAVCDRVAIMVSGKLRCIGSIQQLKSKFGKGYLLEMKVKDSLQADELHHVVTKMFPQAARQDRFSSLLVYKIPMGDVRSLSQAFLQLEEAKRTYNIEEYSFSQSTLEQVFLELVKEQEKDDFDVEKAFRWRQLRSDSV